MATTSSETNDHPPQAAAAPQPPPPPALASIRTPTIDRLSLPFPLRLPLSCLLAGTCGFALGLSHGSSEAGFRFRAENAHRFPTTQTGWYLYHKSKNYHVALGGVAEGAKMAGKMGVWVGVFVGMEEFVDRGRAGLVRQWRGWGPGEDGSLGRETVVVANRDFVSSVFAGLGTAGAFSAWNRFPVPTAARVAKMGAKVGLAFGVVQDVLGLLRGRRLGYVEFIKRHTIGDRSEDVAHIKNGIATARG